LQAHCQNPTSQRSKQSFVKELASQPKRRISKFFSHAKKKKLKHANTRATPTEKKMKRMTSLI
jgi:superfamily I DNA and RNA helicase